MKEPIRIRVRLYPEQDDDLLAWHNSLKHLPYGAKSQAIKEALRRGIRESEGPARSEPLPLDATAVQEAVTSALAQALDLTVIRSVVELAVHRALAEVHIHIAQPPDEEEDDEDGQVVDMLGHEVTMGGEL